MKTSVRSFFGMFHKVLALFSLILLSSVAEARVITADVVALDQVMTWNRFGSYNPVGMMYALRRDVVDLQGNPIGPNGGVPGQVTLRAGKRPRPLVLRANVGDTLVVRFTNLLAPGRPDPNAPTTRLASMIVNGLTPVGDNGIVGLSPGSSITYSWTAEREGTHLIFSNGAPAGGEGDGGSLVLGLFGAVNVEPAGSRWYRSQVTAADLAAAKAAAVPPAVINYEAVDAAGVPILNLLHNNEIISSDLNAVIVYDEADDGLEVTTEGSFREFTTIFHDELKTIHPFAILDHPVMSGVRDGFGVNYGSDGAGARIIANRSGIGPAKLCVECAYEEFFLTSWANGDPALLTQYPEDPSNVHHSYLNDKVKFRNLHAGPKETHVFHLHGHQWLGQTDGENSTYLDSQTIGPLQGFTYEILYGGSGNRNRTVGDSIYHCHLYPHFAQGMWALWRTHEVFEDGTRALPDGEFGAGTDPATGITSGGTPVPAVIPIPGQAMPPMPTYGTGGMPGYPFYIPGQPGHRPPQPPLDIVADGGLPRHIITGGTRTLGAGVATYDFSSVLNAAQIQLIQNDGTALEKTAMSFHASAGHAAVTPEGTAATFKVNGLPAQPGAPYADPCLPGLTTGTREYRVSAIQLDLVVNRHGWHGCTTR